MVRGVRLHVDLDAAEPVREVVGEEHEIPTVRPLRPLLGVVDAGSRGMGPAGVSDTPGVTEGRHPLWERRQQAVVLRPSRLEIEVAAEEAGRRPGYRAIKTVIG